MIDSLVREINYFLEEKESNFLEETYIDEFLDQFNVDIDIISTLSTVHIELTYMNKLYIINELNEFINFYKKIINKRRKEKLRRLI